MTASAIFSRFFAGHVETPGASPFTCAPKEKTRAKRVFLSYDKSEELFFSGCAYRACAFAGTAGNASVCIDNILAFAFRDSVYRALFNACTAHYAIVRNLICHNRTPPNFYVYIILSTLLKSNRENVKMLCLFFTSPHLQTAGAGFPHRPRP